MEIVRYPISNGINCLFEIPTAVAKKWLPVGIQPIEVVHGTSLIGITMFDFPESPVGPYQELVFSLYAVPLHGITEAHPHAAVYPLVVASSFQEARDHAIDLWHLPHFMEDIRLEFMEAPDGGGISGKGTCSRGLPIVELSIRGSGTWAPMYQLYQSFQCDDSGSYIGVMDMQGRLSEHEEQTGEVRLYTDHHFFDHLDLSEMDPMPMREMWMKDGVESYYDLVPFPGRSRKQSVVMV